MGYELTFKDNTFSSDKFKPDEIIIQMIVSYTKFNDLHIQVKANNQTFQNTFKECIPLPFGQIVNDRSIDTIKHELCHTLACLLVQSPLIQYNINSITSVISNSSNYAGIIIECITCSIECILFEQNSILTYIRANILTTFFKNQIITHNSEYIFIQYIVTLAISHCITDIKVITDEITEIAKDLKQSLWESVDSDNSKSPFSLYISNESNLLQLTNISIHDVAQYVDKDKFVDYIKNKNKIAVYPLGDTHPNLYLKKLHSMFTQLEKHYINNTIRIP